MRKHVKNYPNPRIRYINHISSVSVSGIDYDSCFVDRIVYPSMNLCKTTLLWFLLQPIAICNERIITDQSFLYESELDKMWNSAYSVMPLDITNDRMSINLPLLQANHPQFP